MFCYGSSCPVGAELAASELEYIQRSEFPSRVLDLDVSRELSGSTHVFICPAFIPPEKSYGAETLL